MASQTERRSPVPPGASGRSNVRREPAKYPSIWRRASSNNGVSSPPATPPDSHSIFVIVSSASWTAISPVGVSNLSMDIVPSRRRQPFSSMRRHCVLNSVLAAERPPFSHKPRTVMPLSPAVPRRHIHTRRIECRGYLREDGLWDIEAWLEDSKTYAFDNETRGEVQPGGPVHDMVARLTVD